MPRLSWNTPSSKKTAAAPHKRSRNLNAAASVPALLCRTSDRRHECVKECEASGLLNQALECLAQRRRRQPRIRQRRLQDTQRISIAILDDVHALDVYVHRAYSQPRFVGFEPPPVITLPEPAFAQSPPLPVLCRETRSCLSQWSKSEPRLAYSMRK